MTLFYYTAIDDQGKERKGSIDAINNDVAVTALQRRGLTISSINSAESSSVLDFNISFFDRVKNKDIVILSRQITTLFDAQVSALRAFTLLSTETQSPALQDSLVVIANDLQGGSTIAGALAKHPKIFNSFYIAMVKAGEETGRLNESFEFLANYLDRTYEVMNKAKNALIYPAFVIFTFIAVMILMLTTVIPQLSEIILESGQDVPIYTKIVIMLSQFLTNYFWLFIIMIIAGGGFLYKYVKTPTGRYKIARAKLAIPYVGDLYLKLYMSRISDSLSTTLSSGIQLVRGLEITAEVVGDPTYKEILKNVANEVQTGRSMSEVLVDYPEFPRIMVAMIKVGEETGDLGNILKTMSKFYQREVTNAVEMLVSLIEPIMIIMLGLGVGFLLASVLIPIYNLSANL